jgi:hypothetical protein
MAAGHHINAQPPDRFLTRRHILEVRVLTQMGVGGPVPTAK